jgi:hypothetical protein
MATVTKNKNFFKWPKLLYLMPKFELYKHNDERWVIKIAGYVDLDMLNMFAV